MAAALNPVRGSAHYNSKLTEDDVRLILSLAAERDKLRAAAGELTNAKIAEKFEVAKGTIEKITQGRGWSHI